MNLEYTALILLIPLFMFFLLGFNFKRFKEPFSGWLGTLGLFVTAMISYYTAYKYFFEIGKDAEGVYQKIVAFNTLWVHFSDTLHIDMGVLLDPISAMMLIVVPTISLMVHLYSIGYMHKEPGFTRFFAYLSLFTFSMLGLVLSTNLFQIYIFWELVGVSSYLLIGYYYNKPSAVLAAKKAFIVTRFADFGFLIGILMVSYYGKSFDFGVLTSESFIESMRMQGAAFMGLSVMAWALILIFMGGAGKSAMFPLHIWLPDAMEGPTPVSALIHAATMVVAGVYLVARLFPLYYFVDDGAALQVVAYVGAFTTIFAAVIAITQYDIKRVLAFSTMSQIGYMMLALGVSHYEGHEGLGFMSSMFHLFTHAMFKALLFLGAGAIIHAVHSNYMQDMGGLRKYMPVTHITFLLAALAISGIPPLAGFFSKDEILAAAFEHNKLIFFTGYIVAAMTAFYMFRLYFRIFWWNNPKYEHTPHEAPWTMTVPLMVLAFMTVIAGFFPFHDFVTADGKAFATHFDWTLVGASVAAGAIGIFFAWVFYAKEKDLSSRFRYAFGIFYKWTYNKFYFDELYMFVTKKIIFDYISRPYAWFDRHVVDGTMNLIGNGTVWIGEKIKIIQTGRVQDYAMFFLSGVVAIAMLLWFFIN